MNFVNWDLSVNVFGGQGGDEPHVALQESDMHYVLMVVRTNKCPSNALFATSVVKQQHAIICSMELNTGTLVNQYHKLNNPKETMVHGAKVKDLERHFGQLLRQGKPTRAQGSSSKGPTIIVPIARISNWMEEGSADAIIKKIQQGLKSELMKLPQRIDTVGSWVKELIVAVNEVQKTYLAITPSKVS